MDHIPQHVAIIMDGNRRWAKSNGLPAVAGHKKVVEERVEELIERAGEHGIRYITFWAFSTENWGRPPVEVNGIMGLFRLALTKYARRMIARGARLQVIGDISKFDKDIREGIQQFVEESKDNDKIVVTFALNYGGRDEIRRAINRMLKDPKFEAHEIDADEFTRYLDTAEMPDPDLIIRTSGEKRLSGFFPWQSVYSEFYFTDTLMPDFDGHQFDLAIHEFGQRERRAGR